MLGCLGSGAFGLIVHLTDYEGALSLLILLAGAHGCLSVGQLGVLMLDSESHVRDGRVINLRQLVHIVEDARSFDQRRAPTLLHHLHLDKRSDWMGVVARVIHSGVSAVLSEVGDVYRVVNIFLDVHRVVI